MMINNKLLLSVLYAITFVAPVFAADNSCDNIDDVQMVNPVVGLCSTHAYNIGYTDNQSSEMREMMKDVVALKSTVITQQMKKQYDYMDAMLKRFRIQLEKAILTTKLQAAGATDGGNSSSGGNVNVMQNVYEDCSMRGVNEIVYCLRNNLAKINSALAAKQINNQLKEQIIKDARVIRNNSFDTQMGCAAKVEVYSNKNKGNEIPSSEINNAVGVLSGGITCLEVEISNRNRQVKQ